MQIEDENFPPSNHSWSTSPACTDPRYPSGRSVLSEVNMPIGELKKGGSAVSTGQEETCIEDAEAEAWSERTAVITKYDHETHCQLARDLVKDLADQIVEENFKKQEQQIEEPFTAAPDTGLESEEASLEKEIPKPPEDLPIAVKKQQLFLPDLVPSAIISKPSSIGAVSESDEYESADEQPLHDTLYLDTTVNPTSNGFEASTPVENSDLGTDLENSTVVFAGGRSGLNTTAKDITLRIIEDVVNCQPIITSTPAVEEAAPVSACLEIFKEEQLLAIQSEQSDAVGELCQNFADTGIRNSQPFSPSSGSEVENSVVDSVEDTLSAATPSRQTTEVDLDLVTQFEKLVLTKQPSADQEEGLAVSSLDSFFPCPGKEEDLPNLLNAINKELISESIQLNEDIQLSNPVIELVESEVVQDRQQSSSDPDLLNENPSSEFSDPIKEIAVQEAQTLPCSSDSTKEETASENYSVSTPVQSETETLSVSSLQLDEKLPSEGSVTVSTDEAPIGDINVDLIPEEEANLSKIEQIRKPLSLPEDKPIVPKKGYDLSFLDRFDNLENATPSFSQAKLPFSIPENFQTSNTLKDEPIAQSEEARPFSCENESIEGVGVTPAGLDSTFTNSEDKQKITKLSPTDETRSTEVPVDPEPLPEENSIEQTSTVQDTQISLPNNITEQKMENEEEIAIPKKGYDLSWLDKLDDLENASPSAISAKCKTAGSKKIEKKEEPVKSIPAAEESPTAPPQSENAKPQVEESAKADGEAANPTGGSPTKKEPTARKPIRPRFQRPAAVKKTDAFEIEFKFDANDDPFKPKTKLGSSPSKDETPVSAFAQSAFEDNFPSLESNSTINATDENMSSEANNTVIDTLAEQHQPPDHDTIAARLSATADHTIDDEEFRPAQEVFSDAADLDFLMQHGGSSHEIALARQSLFVKFDPLVGGRPSIMQAHQSADGGAIGGDETILIEEQPSGRKSTSESLFLFSPPHPTSGAKTDKKETVPSDAEQPPVVDCLMSSAASRVVPEDAILLHEHREALKLQELLFQDKLLQKEREIQLKENENQEIRAKLEGTIEAQAQMRQIVGEYEKTISQLIAEKEREKASMEATLHNTVKEKDQAVEDLKEVERAFSEFHRMYERNRTAAENLHKNEEALKKALAAYQERLQQEQHKYETLKLHAAQKLEGAQQEMENMRRALEAESSRLKAQLKKTEMRLASVETSLEQKSKENEELTKLCDELINKLGASTK